MESVKDILSAFGFESPLDLDINEAITVEHDSDSQMDLTIERIGENQLSVAHHYVQRGDLMSDPEIVFSITDDGWVAIEYTQHPYVYRHDKSGLVDTQSFADNTWDHNIRNQGYVDLAKEQAASADNEDN